MSQSILLKPSNWLCNDAGSDKLKQFNDTPTTKVSARQQVKSNKQEVSRTYSSAPFAMANTCVIANYRGTCVCASAYHMARHACPF